MELVQIVGLPQLEEMFGPPCPVQRQGDLLPAVMTLGMAPLGQPLGVALAVEDGQDDRHAGQPGDAADDLGQLDVHLLEGLLHVLDMTGGVADLRLPQPPVARRASTESGGRNDARSSP